MIYRYELIRTPRKTISVSISSDNVITVRAPWNVRIEKIDEFLDSKAGWIDKVVDKNALWLALNDDIIEHRKVYLDGEKLPLVISQYNEITPDAVYVRQVADIPPLYKRERSAEFVKKVNELAEQIKLYPASVKVKNYKGRWGCCDAFNNLTFNSILFMLPPELQRYVIIHELCHILCRNHSAGFWKLVSEFEPEYKSLKNELRYYDFLVKLYL